VHFEESDADLLCARIHRSELSRQISEITIKFESEIEREKVRISGRFESLSRAHLLLVITGAWYGTGEQAVRTRGAVGDHGCGAAAAGS